MLTATQQRGHLGAAEQGQQALELAPVGGPALGKSASIQSISACIHFSNASSFSSCYGVAAEGELVICRHGRPIARVLPMAQHRQLPDHADLRQRMAPLRTPSADLIRAEREER